MPARTTHSGKYEFNGRHSLKRPDLKPPTGWSHELIPSLHRPRSHSLSPDGEQIALFWEREDASDLYILPSSGGWPRRLTFGRPALPYWFDEPPGWSQDGNWIAYTAEGHVWIVNPGGGLPEKITSRLQAGGGSPRWLPDSLRLLITYDEGEFSNILLIDIEERWPAPVTPLTGRDSSPEASPEGRMVAYTHRPLNDLERLDIMLANLGDGTQRTIVALPKVENLQPRWSPDGKQISYTSNRTGYFELYLYDLKSGSEIQLTQTGCDLDELSWSPEGKRILCRINRAGAFDLAIVEVETGVLSDVRREAGFHARPQWLPDGNRITFEYDDPSQPADIFSLDILSDNLQQLTFSTPPALGAIDLVTPEFASYASEDGLEIPSFLYKPHTPNGAGIVYPHGGPTAQYALEWDIWAQYMAAKGYTILAPNYRGSSGYGMDFQRLNFGVWGVMDTVDCLAGADYLAGVDGIDKERLGIFGASYGGYMAICALAFDPQHRFACGVSKYGDCNLISSWAECDRSGHEDLYRMMGHPSENKTSYQAGSPVWQVENIQAPLLLFHGGLDPYVPPNQSEELVKALRAAGKTFEYRTYPDEGHGILRKKNLLNFYEHMERFLDWYLL